MDSILKEELVASLLRFNKVVMKFPPGFDIPINELIVMIKIETCDKKNVYVSDIQKDMRISKPAVSKILNILEKKEYITREMDTNDRRKIAVFLTDSGKEKMSQKKSDFDKILTEVLSRFGEENTKQLIVLFGRLAEISEEIESEMLNYI